MKHNMDIQVISHTHWDREWYQPFEAYRARLVVMVDHLLQVLEGDSSYRYFHFDGQTIVLDDYLEIKPENRARLEKLIHDGRLIIGPWYVMPDEFLVSGESLVRNLIEGHAASRAYGGIPMPVGYVVDIFGHNSQFPQILRGFGIESAVLFRGAGDYPYDTFRWAAKDGSPVTVIRLDPDRCYSNFYFAVRWPFDSRIYEPKEVNRRFDELLAYMEPRARSSQRLMMDGVDHIETESALPALLDMIRAEHLEMTIEHGRLEDYCRSQAERAGQNGLETLTGELYQIGGRGVNNVVLKNVLSSLVHLKQQNDDCEIGLLRWAEPFHAAIAPWMHLDLKGFMKKAWQVLMQNHPHDSICGCSITSVHQDNEYRFRQVAEMTTAINDSIFQAIVNQIAVHSPDMDQALILFNPGQIPVDDVLEVRAELPADFIDHFALFGADGVELPFQVLSNNLERRCSHQFGFLPEFPAYKVLTLALRARIPAFGYATYWLQQRPVKFPRSGEYSYQQYHARVNHIGSQATGDLRWENEYLQMQVANGGSLDVLHKPTGKTYRGLLSFIDDGDCGEGYNYRRPLRDQAIYSSGSPYTCAVLADGPLLTKIQITVWMNLPARLTMDQKARSDERVTIPVTTEVTLRAGSPNLDCRTYLTNTATGHRLRLLFPTHLQTDTWYSATPFALEERPIEMPVHPGAQEIETGVVPNQGTIVVTDGLDTLSVFSRGLYEASVRQTPDHAIALTLFRSFPNEIGREGAEMGLMLRDLSFEYAIEFGASSMSPARCLQHSESWRAGTRCLTHTVQRQKVAGRDETLVEQGRQAKSGVWSVAKKPVSATVLPPSMSFLTMVSERSVLASWKVTQDPHRVDADNNDRVSSVKMALDEPSEARPNDSSCHTIRIYNAAGEPDQVKLIFSTAIQEAWLTNLAETEYRELAYHNRELITEVQPYGIMTLGVRLSLSERTRMT